MGTLKKFIFFYFVSKLLKIITKIFGIVENLFILLQTYMRVCVCMCLYAYLCYLL